MKGQRKGWKTYHSRQNKTVREERIGRIGGLQNRRKSGALDGTQGRTLCPPLTSPRACYSTVFGFPFSVSTSVQLSSPLARVLHSALIREPCFSKHS